jgi:hypothetical protein
MEVGFRSHQQTDRVIALVLDSTEESFVSVFTDADEFFLVDGEFLELFTLGLELTLTTILHSGCTI